MPHLVLAYQNVTTHKVIKLSLARENIEVHSFGDGTQALEYTRAQPTDVLLADLALSGKDGYELCNEVRKHPQTAHIPVVLLVGSLDTLDVERAQHSGYTGYLRKPFETSCLVELVKGLLPQSSQVPSRDSGKSERQGAVFPIPASREKREAIFSLTASQCSPEFRLLARQIQTTPAAPETSNSSLHHSEPTPSLRAEELDVVVKKVLESVREELAPLLVELVQDVQKRPR